MIRVTNFSHRVIDLPNNSPCKKALHLSKVTGDHVREGNLVLIELTAQELATNRWTPLQPLKKYQSFKDMV